MQMFFDVVLDITILFISLILLLAIIVFITIPRLKERLKAINDEVHSEEYVVHIQYKNMPLYNIGKRIFDVLFMLVSMIVILPIWGTAVIVSKATKADVYQYRTIVGYKGKPVKLRRLNITLESPKLLRAIGNAGWKCCPDFFSILRGDLSVIGLSRVNNVQEEEYNNEFFEYEKPGMVSLAMLFPYKPESVKLFDSYYLQKRGVSLDVFIFLCVCLLVFDKKY